MTRSASAIDAPAAIAVALLLLTGCAAGDAGSEASSSSAPSASTSPSPSSSPSASPSDEAAAADTSDWLGYATHDGDMTYRYPADWTLESESVESDPAVEGARWFDSTTLAAPTGQQLLQSGDYVDVGGACGEEDRYPIEVLASERASAGEGTTLLTVALGTPDGRWIFGSGIASSDRVPQPGATACGIYFIFGSSDGGMSMGTHFLLASIADDPLWTVDSIDDARAYMETEEYATILEILRSVVLA